MTRIILASASPRRRELLRALIDAFEVVPADVPEPLTDDPLADALALALAKARHIANLHPDAVVIGADTVVFDAERSYGKPADEPEAIRMWRALGGRTHRVVTGIAVVAATGEFTASGVSSVTLADLDTVRIADYVFSGRPMDKAGAYAIQDEDVPTVERLEGCYCSVMGLGLWTLRDLLARAGIEAREPSATFARCAQACASKHALSVRPDTESS